MRIVALAAVLGGAAYGFTVFRRLADFESTDDAQVDADVVQVSAQVSGTVKSVYVHDDENVTAGQLLVTLDPARYKLAVDQAKANLAIALADAKTAGIDVTLTAATGKADEVQAAGGIDQAVGGIGVAAAAVTKAQADLQSAKVAQTIADTDFATYDIAVETSRLALNRSHQQTLSAKAGLDVSNAAVASAQTTLASAKTKHEITAKELSRARDLLSQGAISGRQLETAENSEADAMSALDAAKQQYDSALATVRQRSADYEAARVSEQSAQAAIRQAELQRQSAALRKHTARTAVDSSLSMVNSASRNVSVARGKKLQSQGVLATAKTDVEKVNLKKATVGQMEARVQQAQAALAQAELDLQHCKIVAPFSGHIGKKLILPGTVLQSGAPVLSVVNYNTLQVAANFKETQIEHIHPGQHVTIEVDGFKDHVFHGEVASTSPATGAAFSLLPPDNANGNFVKVVQRIPVTIALDPDDSERFLHVGMSALVKVKVK